jgi:hypothetical protein
MLRVNPLILPSGGSLNDFPVGAGCFRGDQYLNRGADLTGNANSKVCTLSFWFKYGSWGARGVIHEFGGAWNSVYFDTDDRITFVANDVSGSLAPVYMKSSVVPRDHVWHHYVFAFSLGTTNITRCYVDGVNVPGANQSAPTNTVIGWAGRGAYILGRSYDTDTYYQVGSLAEFYFNNKEFVDVSIPSNMAKFRNAAGKPVNLGPDGSWVTGNKPIVYFRYDPFKDPNTNSFRINRGSDGATFGLRQSPLYREPTPPGLPWVDVYGTTPYSESVGWAGYTLRQVINVAGMVNVPLGQTQVRVTVAGSPANGAATWNKMYIGHQYGPECQASDLTQLFFNGGSPGGTAPQAGSLISDAANWTWNRTNKVILTTYFPSAGATVYGLNYNTQLYYSTGDYADWLDTTGYYAGSAQYTHLWMGIEMI